MDHQQQQFHLPDRPVLQNLHQEFGMRLPATEEFFETQPDGTIAVCYKDIFIDHLMSQKMKREFQLILSRANMIVHLQCCYDLEQIQELQLSHMQNVIDGEIWYMMYFHLQQITDPIAYRQLLLFHEIKMQLTQMMNINKLLKDSYPSACYKPVIIQEASSSSQGDE